MGYPPFSPKNKCVSNDLEWLEMHFKHNFKKVKFWSDSPLASDEYINMTPLLGLRLRTQASDFWTLGLMDSGINTIHAGKLGRLDSHLI